MRLLPGNGERGKTAESQPLPLIKIGNRTLRLAPGGLIFDQQNRTILQQHLPANAEVLFTRNQSGDIQRLYLLSDQEVVRLKQAGTP